MAKHNTNHISKGPRKQSIHFGLEENKKAQECAQAHIPNISPQLGCPEAHNPNFNFNFTLFNSKIKDFECNNELENFHRFSISIPSASGTQLLVPFAPVQDSYISQGEVTSYVFPFNSKGNGNYKGTSKFPPHYIPSFQRYIQNTPIILSPPLVSKT